jgi:hypothetical protein
MTDVATDRPAVIKSERGGAEDVPLWLPAQSKGGTACMSFGHTVRSSPFIHSPSTS